MSYGHDGAGAGVGASSPAPSPPRACVVCGSSLSGRRRQAIHCSGACRAEAARLRAILAGSPGTPYLSVAERLAARRKRTQPLPEPVRSTTTTQTAGRRANAPGPAPKR